MRPLPTRKYSSGTRWCAWRWTDVDPQGDGVVYLTRLHIFQTPWCSWMLHWIWRADPQSDLHDHPTTFLSIVLRGWYEEEVPDVGAAGQVRRRRVAFWNFKRAVDRHRIVALGKDTLTMVFAGPVVRAWGFYAPEGWVAWREYVARHQGKP